MFVLVWMSLNPMPWIELEHSTDSVEGDVLCSVDLVSLRIVPMSRGSGSFLYECLFDVYAP